MSGKTNIKCPSCSSKNTIKKGARKNKQQTIQKYRCKQCKKHFTLQQPQSKHKTYPISIILRAISAYNLGNTLEKTAQTINNRYKLQITQPTILAWLNEYRELCAYNKLRKEAKKLYKPKNIIFSKTFYHIQPYTFRYHKAKLYLLFHSIKYNNQFINQSKYCEPTKQYLEKIPTDKFPHHIFKGFETKVKEGIIKPENVSPNADITKNNINNIEKNNINTINNENKIEADNNLNNEKINNETILKNNNATYSLSFIAPKFNNFETSDLGQDDTNKNLLEQRASKLKLKMLPIIKKQKDNFANKLAKLALLTAKSNKDRHSAIQNFFLINDSTTIAVEVPVYLTKDDIKYYKKRDFSIEFLEKYATPITGHIDILQIRNGLIHILDYKPDAHLKQVQQQAIPQLTIYALALASRTKLDLASFKCAFFDEDNYYEFFPLHAVYEKQNQKA